MKNKKAETPKRKQTNPRGYMLTHRCNRRYLHLHITIPQWKFWNYVHPYNTALKWPSIHYSRISKYQFSPPVSQTINPMVNIWLSQHGWMPHAYRRAHVSIHSCICIKNTNKLLDILFDTQININIPWPGGWYPIHKHLIVGRRLSSSTPRFACDYLHKSKA